MRLVKTLLLASPLLLSTAGSLKAQEVAGVKPGDRVRVTVGEGMEYNHNQIRYLSGEGELEPRVIIGTVSQRSEALLAITGWEGQDFWEVPSSSVKKLELNTKSTRTFGRTLPRSLAIFGGGLAIYWGGLAIFGGNLAIFGGDLDGIFIIGNG